MSISVRWKEIRFCKEQTMINEEKVKIMTKLAMYEQGRGRETSSGQQILQK